MKILENIVKFIKDDYQLIIIAYIVYLLCGIGVITSALLIVVATILSVVIGDIFGLFER